LAKAFAGQGFTPLAGSVRVDPGPYYLYLGGLGLLLAGGSGLFIRLYVFLAGVVRVRVLRAPLEAIGTWPRLLGVVHGVTFGTFVLFAAVIYFVPQVQYGSLVALQSEIHSGSGPLRLAGTAYMSRNILYAAGVTLGINFLGGSIVSITVPSIIVPGAGALVAWLRAAVLGLVLAPSVVALAGVALAHSFTILVEMEAYILAAFFGLMIPIYLFRKAEGPTALGRYAKALLLNLQAYLLVGVLLAVAAIYEALEVILQMP
jgi:hypothetical protein